MFGSSGYAAAMQTVPGWTLLFAREPEPDLDIEDLPQGLDDNPSQRFMDKKPPNRRPLLWVLILVVVGVAVYAMTQPEMLQMIGMGAPEPPKPTIAKSPKPAVPAAPATPAAPGAPAPVAPGIPAPSTPGAPVASAPAPTASSPGATPSMPPAAAPSSATAGKPILAAPATPSTQPARPAASAPTPLFKEGQRVVVQSDPKQLTGTVFLSADSAGVVPGPLVKPGSTLVVTDGELRNNVWVYSVRTEDGTVGWIPESRLKVKS